ncbi:MAG: cysteine hydrolase [Caulobacterales bacterium]|nr:cysteine hydrolase [Caulobacterales bacterium]
MSTYHAFEPPLLVLLDVQQEQSLPGRPLFSPTYARCAEETRALLLLARRENWLIAHCSMERSGAVFGGGTAAARPVSGVEPIAGEMIFPRSELSACANGEFTDLLKRTAPAPILVCGPATPQSLLATAFTAFDAGRPLSVVTDTIAAPAVDTISAAEVARCTLALVGTVADLVNAADVSGDEPGRQGSPRRLDYGGSEHG